MLEVRNIEKSYQRKVVLDKVSFSAAPGQCVGIAGHNGSGKSTLLSIIAQVLRPDGGEVLFNEGVDEVADKVAGNSDVSGDTGKSAGAVPVMPVMPVMPVIPVIPGYVPQENSLLEDLSVKETLDFWLRVYGLPVKDLFTPSSPATMLGLGEIRKARVAKLSGGMRKRLSVAIALLSRSSLLLFDEAFTALDRAYRLELEAYVVDFCKKGGCVLYCSHDIKELLDLCERIIVLRQGQKIFDDAVSRFPDEAAALDFLLNPDSAIPIGSPASRESGSDRL